MSRAWILLPLVATAFPLAAQLTPEQRAARENAPSAANSTRLSDSWERRSLDGDPTAYFGPAGRDARRQTEEQIRMERMRFQPHGLRLTAGAFTGGSRPTASDLGDHWFAIGQRSGTPRELRRVPVGPVDVRADVPLALTLASPIGGPGRPLMIRTAVRAAQSPDGWSRMGEVMPGPNGMYRVEIPALRAGTYDLTIAVYDLDVPEIPFSSSESKLIVWTP